MDSNSKGSNRLGNTQFTTSSNGLTVQQQFITPNTDQMNEIRNDDYYNPNQQYLGKNAKSYHNASSPSNLRENQQSISQIRILKNENLAKVQSQSAIRTAPQAQKPTIQKQIFIKYGEIPPIKQQAPRFQQQQTKQNTIFQQFSNDEEFVTPSTPKEEDDSALQKNPQKVGKVHNIYQNTFGESCLNPSMQNNKVEIGVKQQQSSIYQFGKIAQDETSLNIKTGNNYPLQNQQQQVYSLQQQYELKQQQQKSSQLLLQQQNQQQQQHLQKQQQSQQQKQPQQEQQYHPIQYQQQTQYKQQEQELQQQDEINLEENEEDEEYILKMYKKQGDEMKNLQENRDNNQISNIKEQSDKNSNFPLNQNSVLRKNSNINEKQSLIYDEVSKEGEDNTANLLELSSYKDQSSCQSQGVYQSLFKYDPAMFQSAGGYFFNQNAEEQMKLDWEKVVEEIKSTYQNDDKKCQWLQKIVNIYMKDQSKTYIERINREIQGLQGAENLGDFFVKKYSMNREKKIAGCSHAQKFPVYIGVRGDGNCFYRALIVSYFTNILCKIDSCIQLENILNSIEKGEIKLIELQYKGVERQDSQKVKSILIQELLMLLLQRKKAKDQTEIQMIIRYMLEKVSADHDLDYSFVLLCRSMIFEGVEKYAHLPCYTEYILPDEIERTKEKLKAFKEDAEFHVISLSTDVFKHSIQILSLQKDKLGHFEFNESLIYNPQVSEIDKSLTCYILLSDLHYDLLFDREICLSYFPSLSLFKNHEIYKEDLAFILNDPTLAPTRENFYTSLYQEYQDFLKDQQVQMIKSQQSQANLESYFQSRLRSSMPGILPYMDSQIYDSQQLELSPSTSPGTSHNRNLSGQKQDKQYILENIIDTPEKNNKDNNILIQEDSEIIDVGSFNKTTTKKKRIAILDNIKQEKHYQKQNEEEEEKQDSHKECTPNGEEEIQDSQDINQLEIQRNFSESFYNVNSDRAIIIKQFSAGQIDQRNSKNQKQPENKVMLSSCIHSQETSVLISQVVCCKLMFEICYPCFKTRQIIICPHCKKDVLSNIKISQTTKNMKLGCKKCGSANNQIIIFFNKVYCAKCDFNEKID